MPNIKQQKKRVGTAARQRFENLRFKSTVKTLTRRLRAAVEDGDSQKIAEEHRELVRWIDRAAANGALHKNTAARKKARGHPPPTGGGILFLPRHTPAYAVRFGAAQRALCPNSTFCTFGSFISTLPAASTRNAMPRLTAGRASMVSSQRLRCGNWPKSWPWRS